jgi:tetratricopeptide (TPR) repeat protein
MRSRLAGTCFRGLVSLRVHLAAASLFLACQEGLVLGHGDYHERMDYLTKAIQQNPSDPVLRFELANLHGQHGDLALALKDLDKIDELAPGKYPTDLLRGQAYLVARDFPKARQAFDRQIGSHPEMARAWLLRARAERELGQREASLADYREALKRTTSPEPDLIEEVAGALAADGKKEEAAQVLAGGIEKLGKIPSLVLRAVDLEIEAKNFDAALLRLEQARKDAPRPEPWMARKAAVLAQAGRMEESRAAWKALLEHLESLPEQERSSRAMSALTQEARDALAKL